MPSPDPRAPSRSLDRLETGRSALVLEVRGPGVDELLHEGIAPGVLITVGSRTPLGGPLIIEVGRRRVAVARLLATDVHVRPTPLA